MRYDTNGPLTCPSDRARRALLAEAIYVVAGIFAILGAIGYAVFGLLA